MLSSICLFFFFTAVLSASDEHEYVQYRAHGTHARTFCSRGCAWAFNSTVDHGNCEPKWRGLIKHLGRYDFLGGDIYRRSQDKLFVCVGMDPRAGGDKYGTSDARWPSTTGDEGAPKVEMHHPE